MTQPKFKIGDRVRVRTSGNSGVIKQIMEGDYWFGPSVDEFEYRIDFDNGESSIIVEKVLDLDVKSGPKCTCGAVFTSFKQIHSDWCDMYMIKEYLSYNDGTGD